MQLSLIGFVDATARFAAGAQAATTQALDFTKGSVIRALAEAQAAVGLWVQWSILRVLSMTRLSTSVGEDVDSFVGDFGPMRLPAIYAGGAVTVSRNAATIAALVLPGTLIRSSDGTVTVAITTDTTNLFWSTTAGASPGYFLPLGTVSATLPAIATVPGQVGNVGAGTLTLLATAVPGIDSATNAAPFTGGIDAESDAALQARFPLFIQGLASATDSAILSAVASVQQGVKAQLLNNTPSPGFYTLYVDDGSGDPSDAFLATIYAAVAAVTAEGVQPIVLRFTQDPVTINVDITAAYGANLPAVDANVSAALAAYVATIQGGGTLSYLRLPSVIFGADTNVTTLNSLTVNGATSDILAGPGGLIVTSSINVS